MPDRTIQHFDDGEMDTRPWITHRTGFDDLIHEFDFFTKPETGVSKVIVEVT